MNKEKLDYTYKKLEKSIEGLSKEEKVEALAGFIIYKVFDDKLERIQISRLEKMVRKMRVYLGFKHKKNIENNPVNNSKDIKDDDIL